MNEEICSECGHKMKREKLNTPQNDVLVWCVNGKCPIVIRFEECLSWLSEGDCE